MNKREILDRIDEVDTVWTCRDGVLMEVSVDELVVRPAGLYWVGPSSGELPFMLRYEAYGTTWAFEESELALGECAEEHPIKEGETENENH